MLNKIKSFYQGRYSRGEFLGCFIFCHLITSVILTLSKEQLVPYYTILIISPIVIVYLLGAIIRRANEFTDTPWFYGFAYLLKEIFGIINFFIPTGLFYYFAFAWGFMVIRLLFIKADNKENKKNGLKI